MNDERRSFLSGCDCDIRDGNDDYTILYREQRTKKGPGRSIISTILRFYDSAILPSSFAGTEEEEEEPSDSRLLDTRRERPYNSLQQDKNRGEQTRALSLVLMLVLVPVLPIHSSPLSSICLHFHISAIPTVKYVICFVYMQ